MNDALMGRCSLFITNRDAARAAIPGDSVLVHLCCAALFTQQGLKLDSGALRETRKLLRSQTGGFSDFRRAGESIYAAILNASGDPQRLLDQAQGVYALLQRDFMRSSYLPLASFVLAQRVEPGRYKAVAARTRALYLRIRREHPFLTGSEDNAMCALLAMSDMSDDALIDRMEDCYNRLKPYFIVGNAVQALSHVLALMPGTPEELCARTIQLFELLRNRGYRWGNGLALLGLLAGSGRELKTLSEEITEADDWLKTQPGLHSGFFSNVSNAQRLMFAGLMAHDQDPGSPVAITIPLSTVIAQQVVMIAIIMAVEAADND